GQGDEQHLHQRSAERADRGGLPVHPGPPGDPGRRRAQRAQGALRPGADRRAPRVPARVCGAGVQRVRRPLPPAPRGDQPAAARRSDPRRASARPVLPRPARWLARLRDGNAHARGDRPAGRLPGGPPMSATRPPSPAAASSTSAPPLAKRPVPVIFERGAPGRVGYSLPPSDVPDVAMDAIIPSRHRRARPAALPEVSELDVVRHYTALSHRNYSIDEGFYPLGSCTMKYNPKINEDVARQSGIARLHPYQPEELAQGALQLLWELEHDLAAISGMDRVTFQPAAGAHGEMTALLMIRRYFEDRGERRTTVVVPDSAHGTNPASAAIAGFQLIEVKSDRRGNIDREALRAVLTPEVAALMLTNPNTLGLFEEQIREVARAVHNVGAQLYLDGANFNAILGITRP